MHVMHGSSVSGYAMVLTILSPVMGQIASLSCGGLGEVTDYGKKIQTENPVYMSTKAMKSSHIMDGQYWSSELGGYMYAWGQQP